MLGEGGKLLGTTGGQARQAKGGKGLEVKPAVEFQAWEVGPLQCKFLSFSRLGEVLYVIHLLGSKVRQTDMDWPIRHSLLIMLQHEKFLRGKCRGILGQHSVCCKLISDCTYNA